MAQIAGGIAKSQNEIACPGDLGLSYAPGVEASALLSRANDAVRMRLVALMRASVMPASGLDGGLELIRDQLRRFSDGEVAPFAHQWQLKDELIPMEGIAKLADMGVFGLTISETHGGFGLSKTAMVVVSEELSRGYIAVD